MLGHLTGVSTRLRNEASHLITIHCCAHRLELAIKDIWKELPLISEMDTVLKETYNFYKQSRSNWTVLKIVAAEQKLELKRPKKVQGTRWVSHHFDALDSVSNNWPAMVMH